MLAILWRALALGGGAIQSQLPSDRVRTIRDYDAPAYNWPAPALPDDTPAPIYEVVPLPTLPRVAEPVVAGPNIEGWIPQVAIPTLAVMVPVAPIEYTMLPPLPQDDGVLAMALVIALDD